MNKGLLPLLLSVLVYLVGCQSWNKDYSTELKENFEVDTSSGWLEYRDYLRTASPRDLDKEEVIVRQEAESGNRFDSWIRLALLNMTSNYPNANPKKAREILTKLAANGKLKKQQKDLVVVMLEITKDLEISYNRERKLRALLDRKKEENATLESKIDALTNLEKSLAKRQNSEVIEESNKANSEVKEKK